MRGDLQLVDANANVVGEGRVGEFLYVERSGKPITLCADLGHELLLVEVPPGHGRMLGINPEALLR